MVTAGERPYAGHSFHEVIRGGVLKQHDNTIAFVSSGDPADSARFSDVVMLIQREV